MMPLLALMLLPFATLVAAIIFVHADTPLDAPMAVFDDRPFYMQISKNNVTLFRMGPEACLRGPLHFFDLNGKEVFALERGVEYPTGCGGNR